MKLGAGTVALGLALLSVTEAVPAEKRQEQGEGDGSPTGEFTFSSFNTWHMKRRAETRDSGSKLDRPELRRSPFRVNCLRIINDITFTLTNVSSAPYTWCYRLLRTSFCPAVMTHPLYLEVPS